MLLSCQSRQYTWILDGIKTLSGISLSFISQYDFILFFLFLKNLSLPDEHLWRYHDKVIVYRMMTPRCSDTYFMITIFMYYDI